MAAAAAVLVILEAMAGPTMLAKAGLAAAGLLALYAVVGTDARPIAVATAAGVSLLVSAAFASVPALRPEVTTGVGEFLLLSAALVRMIVRGPLRRAALSAATVAVALVASPVRLLGHPRDDRAIAQDAGLTRPDLATFILCWILLISLLGLYLSALERRRADADRLVRQAERLAQARDLHDFVAHHVTAIVAQTKAIRYVGGTDARPSPADMDAMLAGIERSGVQALTSMRTLVGSLRDDTGPAVLRHRTLDDLLAAVVEQFPRTGPAPTVHIDEALAGRPLPADSLDAIHHTVLEALTNVLRHTTGVSRIDIRIRPAEDRPDLSEVSVRNDGEPAPSTFPAGGFGLTGLAERVQALGGSLSAGPVPPSDAPTTADPASVQPAGGTSETAVGRGWQVTALVPLVSESPVRLGASST
ncbi:sensor histidine kinase [Actinoplanes sp. NPDC049265]|uniref:sensor histidine kinase n=1 Tax=Actinoplanes sp. NPDC049265 TaxID=3363902 RepID=UPI003719384D